MPAIQALPFGRKGFFVSALGIAAIAGAFYWHVIAAAPAVTYGDSSQTYFGKTDLLAGEETMLCFSGVTWHRLCPGTLSTWLTPVDGKSPRIDLQSHQIAAPLQTGAVAPKCRPWRVPATIRPGEWRLDGMARNSCSPREVATSLPTVSMRVVTK